MNKQKIAALLLIYVLITQSLCASPEERAQMLKSRILQRMISDGWQLVQESQSLLILERPITGMNEFAVRLLTTGANGSRPVFRWSLAVIPATDHYSALQAAGSINSQNAFGQMTSIPATRGNNREYILGVLASASARMPAKYKYSAPQ